MYKRSNYRTIFLKIAILLFIVPSYFSLKAQNSDNHFISHVINPKVQAIRFFLKDSAGENIRNFKILKDILANNGDSLIFATNGGMFKPDYSPKGLYIENGNRLSDIDTVRSGFGNFYMQPNGIFYLRSDNTPGICKTGDFPKNQNIQYATQSGPLLLINGEIHPMFTEGSSNVYIRNGVGILPNGHLLFAMSKIEMNSFDFATFFINHGCQYALYLDGFVSKTYLPAKGFQQTDGEFGVIIGEVK